MVIEVIVIFVLTFILLFLPFMGGYSQNEEAVKAKISRKKGNMNYRFRQFSLLLWKDSILIRRNKVWTLFELLIPTSILLLIVYLVVKFSSTSTSPVVEFESFSLKGSVEDVLFESGFGKSTYKRWCLRSDVILGYTVTDSSSRSVVDGLMSNLQQKYQSSKIRMSVEGESNEDELRRILINDKPPNNETLCVINKYVGGVVFDEIDLTTKKLVYRVLIGPAKGEEWQLTSEWADPYGARTWSSSRIPREPPYWTAGFLTIQHAIETAFVEAAKGSAVTNSGISFQGLPEPAYQMNSVAAFISFFPFIWAFVTFINVVHVTREIAAENGSVKPYLTAMGLSSSMFYLAHIVIAFVKFFIIFLVTTIPLTTVLKFASPEVLLISILLYGLGAILFGALVASFFENTSSAIKAILIAWGIMLGLAYNLMPSLEKIGQCFIYGLNINGAFALAISAISDYMNRERELNIWNMFNDSTLHFSLGWSLVMMIVDIIWMWIAIMVVDYIRTSADFSIRNLFERKEQGNDYMQTDGITAQNTRLNEQMNVVASSSLSPPNIDSDSLLEGSTEIDGARESGHADINVSRLVKIWSSTGERAVDGLSLKAIRGQVAVLLGHNGAGKSTTFSSIAGIIKPTSGNISICGYDVVHEAHKTRSFIGLCPQYNPLYEKLTVKEHLQLVHGLKGADRTTFNGEMNRLLTAVKLESKDNEISMNLSGGMKRKLCVCMALIGESEVVLLDEPTAGMDPGARKDVQELLEIEKNNRTILLTTHYMDEAERLGDWIFIMSHGRLVVSATTGYLKQKYGSGYLLTVVLDHRGEKRKMADILTAVCQNYIEGAERGEMHGQQIEIVLPEKQKHEFVPLFRAIEAIVDRDFKSSALSNLPNDLKSQLANLMITSYGLSLNTLEQVFITVGDKVNQALASRQNSRASHHSRGDPSLKPPGYDTQTSTKSADSYQRLMDGQARGPDREGLGRIAAQVCSIFRKKLLYTYRNWAQLFGQVVIPLILLGLVAWLSTLRSVKTDSYRNFSPENLGLSRIVWHFNEGRESQEALDFLRIVKKYEGFIIQNYGENDPLLNITKKLIGEMPPAGFGMSPTSDELTTLFNFRSYHVLPTLVSMINRARLGFEARIESGIELYFKDDATSGGISTSLIDILLTPLLILIFAMVTSTFVMFLIEERVSKFAHQQFLTGISPVTFYISSFIYDGIVYAIICTIFLFLFVIFQWMTDHFIIVILFWILFFFSCVPFIYAVSFLFSSPSKANVLLIIWQVVISGIALIFVFLVAVLFNIDESLKKMIADVCLFLLPSYAFGHAIMTINTLGRLMDNKQLMEWDHVGKNAVFMAAFGVFSLTLFVVLQFKPVRKFLSQVWTIRRTLNNNVLPLNADLPICESVEEEREMVQNGDVSKCALVVKELSKTFGATLALNDLCLAVNEKECFGLLGVNGAGKTTTFNILTGQSFATSGDAMIGGRDVTDQISIGYCPQFDALLLDLTGRECLEILAQMHGFSDYKKKADLVLECVGMLNHADKLVRFYSGGQKRKISVGVALLAPTQMIILDEPTAGIDPKARREVWELLLWCREHSNSALMLTSHSMDECEALCSRIAVLNRGSLIAIGTSQELKSLYGNNYTMTLSLNNMEERMIVCKAVEQKFPNAILKTSHTNKTLNLKWQIPKVQGDKWSTKYEQVQMLSNTLRLKDFILAQSSLEETFLRLAGCDDEYQSDSIPRSTNGSSL